MPTIRTLVGPFRLEIPKIKGSRFIADVAPAADETEAMAAIERVRTEFPDANHHCFAFRLDEDTARTSDDGEPGGTAGEPILKRIDGADLCGVVVVVTRYFGGTKLGMGGLVRAYGEAAAAALAEAEIEERRVTTTVALGFAYEQSGAVKSVLTAWELEPVGSDYGARVDLRLAVPVEQVDDVVADLTERTAGRIDIEIP